jgi:hypothetical protein
MTIKSILCFSVIQCIVTASCSAQVCVNTEKNPVSTKTPVITNQTPEKPLAKYTLDDVLNRLRLKTTALKSYKCRIEYLFIQDPELLDSRTLRKGALYYLKNKPNSDLKNKPNSYLRLDFDTIKQDDGVETGQKEQFLYDGVWLAKIDYQLSKVDYYQQAPEGKPQDVFEFVSENFPIVGFSKTDDLQKQFEIKLVELPVDPNDPVHLHLTVRKDSIYKDDYRYIDFWIDGRTFLPARVVSKSTADDVYDIQFLDAVIDKNLENALFAVETPASFSRIRHPMTKESEQDR